MSKMYHDLSPEEQHRQMMIQYETRAEKKERELDEAKTGKLWYIDGYQGQDSENDK